MEGVEIAAVQRTDDRAAQVGEQIAEAEREPAPRLQHVEGHGVQVRFLVPDRDHQVRDPAPVPARSVARLVEEAKGDAILERDHLETSRPKRREDARFQKEPVGIRRNHQVPDAGVNAHTMSSRQPATAAPSRNTAAHQPVYR